MTARELPFIDPISGKRCFLVIPAGGHCYPAIGQPKIGIRHPRCVILADLAAELDAFWCRNCHWNGRISGQWAMDKIADS